ncbi:MAG: serine/threonine protein kinase [Planctomycetes bacterium]|nr:serine/threonine protein kinase [Planctomycetota bacterium]
MAGIRTCVACGEIFVGPVCPHCDARKARPSPAPVAIRGFEILEPLGGGMADVFKARQAQTGRLVALKVLRPSWDPEFSVRFEREARTLASLSHPSIVACVDFGECAGAFFLATEFVDGSTLREILKAGRMPPGAAVTLMAQVLDALAFAHSHGVIHRDVKPENILVDRGGRVKVADFGLAKAAGPGILATSTGEVLGTTQYMSPEQGLDPRSVDPRADLFSVGVVLYELLTGERPEFPPEPPSAKARVPRRLDPAVLQALARDPAARWPDAEAFKEALTRATQPYPPTPE